MSGARNLKLVFLAVATAMLGISAYVAQNGLVKLRSERMLAAQLQARLEGVRQVLPEVRKREALARSVEDVSAKITQLGLDPGQWGERRIRKTLGSVSRVDASRFLADLGPVGPRAFLLVDVFDMAVTTPGAGLFNTPLAGDQGLSMGVSGTLYFITAKQADPS